MNGKELTDYKIKENPKKIDVLDLNCAKIISDSKNDAANVMASDPSLRKLKKVKCVKEKFLAGNYFDAMAVAVALSQAENLTMEQQNQERNKFIEVMKRMDADLNECVLKKNKKKEEEN